ncbi:TPA: hypothetical protein ACNABL_004799 [Escherichia coli]
MLNKEKILEMYKKGELERMTWEEFLDTCDASHYMWNHYPESENVIREEGDLLLVKVDLEDDPDISWRDWLEFEFIVDWGVPVIITNPPAYRTAYIVLQKMEDGGREKYVPFNGELFPTEEEALKELEEILQEED